jgi:hypothetical protein
MEMSFHATGIELHHIGVESHSSLNVGEERHSPLCQTYLKVKHEHPNIRDDLALAISNQAINDIPCEKGMSPTLLVFGTTPRIPHDRFLLPKQPDGMKSMMTARDTYENILALRRVKKGLRHAPPAAVCNKQIQLGSSYLHWISNPRLLYVTQIPHSRTMSMGLLNSNTLLLLRIAPVSAA